MLMNLLLSCIRCTEREKEESASIKEYQSPENQEFEFSFGPDAQLNEESVGTEKTDKNDDN